MQERFTKKSAKVQGARACVRARRRISQLFTSHAVTLREDVQKSRKKEGKNDGEKT